MLTAAGSGVLLLIGLGLVSLFVGSGHASIGGVWQVLRGDGSGNEAPIVNTLRIPRIPVAVLAGACLGAAGALTQTLTRNPIAEPGLLGVNAGASLAVAVAMLGHRSLAPATTVVVAMVGALGIGCLVLLLGGVLRGHHDPLRLVLGGAALSAITSAMTNWLIVSNPTAFTAFRHWDSGAVEPRPTSLLLVGVALAVASAVAIGCIIGQLDALALGDDMAGALGVRPRLTWAITGTAAACLCGVATALAGPISFLGLVAPLVVRRYTGPRIGPLVVGSALVGACVLLASDVAGRVLLPPREIAASIICSVIGAPAFVLVARRMRVVSL